MRMTRFLLALTCVASLLVIRVPFTLANAPQPSALPGAAAQGPGQPRFEPGSVLVKFRPQASEAALQSVAGALSAVPRMAVAQIGVRRLTVPAGKEDETVAALRQNPLVEYAERNMVVRAIGVTPNDPYFAARQWNLRQINAPDAWGIGTGSKTVIIAIVDTGIDLNHPDLAAQVVPGYDFADDDKNPQDEHGHGTHVAGIVAAASNNGVGVAGVCWQCRLLPVKVLDAFGSGTADGVAAGIAYAADKGAKIINLSLGMDSPSQTIQDAINYAYAHGALIVAAAGNCGDPESFQANGCSTHNPIFYPAAGEHVLAVAATDEKDARASFSEYGAFVDVAAPGVAIYSTILDDAYDDLSGTSMAAPHVAGLAGLIWSLNPALTNLQVEQLLEKTAVDLGSPGRDDSFGFGRIDAYAALQAARPVPSLPAPNLISPANGSQLKEGQRVTLRWSGLAKEYYGEVWRTGKTIPFGWQRGTTKDLGALEAGYAYSWHVKARNGPLESPWSKTATFTVTLAAPSDLRAQVISSTQTILSWKDRSSFEEGYKVYRNGALIGQTAKNVARYEDKSPGNPPYSYHVAAFRGDSLSDPSNTVVVCPDVYEADDTLATARSLVVDAAAQRHIFHAPGDVDWVRFTAAAGVTYTLRTLNLGLNNDTVLELYDSGGKLIAANDDGGGGLASRLVWRAAANGSFYLKVRHYRSNRGGCTGYEYDLSVAIGAR